MGSVKEKVSGALLGSNGEPQLPQRSKANFMDHAVKDEESGEYYLSENEFIEAIAPDGEDYHKIKRSQYGILFRIADRSGSGRVSMSDWAVFENLLARADAEYEIAFRVFDVRGTGSVSFEDFQQLYNRNKGDYTIPFDWNSGWAELYTGGRRHRHEMSYPQFAQMVRGLQGERIRQAFHHFDKDNDGYIDPEDFSTIIRATAGHKLSDHLLDNLQTLCNIGAGSKISYANVRAFQNVIHEMDIVELIVRNAVAKSEDEKITRTDFLNEAARTTRFSLFTPMEADILFHFAGLDEPSGRLGLTDFAKVLDESWQSVIDLSQETVMVLRGKGAAAFARTEHILHDLAQSAYHFALGSIAGAFGAFMVYPIDLVKTRMQNQRSRQGVGNNLLYKNSMDCARKVLQNEGLKGLYSGVLPQLVGVAPEKAIKLTMNDLVRGKFMDKNTGDLKLKYEVLAGGSAGASQVMFTNPLEIVKIRLQLQGELARSSPDIPHRSAWWIVKNLGVVGLYKGAGACLLRDVPFSAIYFPAYSHLKRDLFGETHDKPLGVLQLLTAGAIAGMPAAYMTTPMDVIKTRLQVEARRGEQTYSSITNCARTVFQQEGFKAFFKGGPARVLRSSPQFGFTLAGFEVLQNLIPGPGDEEAATPTGGRKLPEQASLPHIRSRNALKIILDLDQNFGQAKGQAALSRGGSWLRRFGIGSGADGAA